MSEHYVEVHVNVEPFDRLMLSQVIDVDRVATPLGFRRAKLLMDKGQPAPDAFFTWRGTDVALAEVNTRLLIQGLKDYGVKVLRYKLEMTLVDSQQSDRWGLLS